ncbi:phage integrase N-terminal SAM-like domain-containing protein [Nitrosococcus oceani]|uniref:phage integrase N-terminal SAM-like domain-containing protein n=1 Tax=Nitrosococcus oceani TaxID=1229 RepID=UPI000A442AE1
MSRKNTPTWLEEVRRIMRLKHDSLHTERTYSDWIKQFVRFHRLTEKNALFVESEAKVESLFKRVGSRAECSGCHAKLGDECVSVVV